MKKERSDKVRRIIFLETEMWFFEHYRPERRDVGRDYAEIRAEDDWELTRLYLELYPDPPKDLMEDLKIRLKKYHEAKAEKGKMGLMARIKCFINQV